MNINYYEKKIILLIRKSYLFCLSQM